MRVSVTGATGLIGSRLVSALRARGDEVVVLSRDPKRALHSLEDGTDPTASGALPKAAATDLLTVAWNPSTEPAPAAGLSGSDAVVHLAGEPIAQRWSSNAKQAIRASRVEGTRNLVAGISALEAEQRPQTLISGSAVGYYGPHGVEPIDEDAPPGPGFLAQTCVAWEAEADAAERLGLRVVKVRTGVLLDRAGGALAKMLPPFKLGVGGPVAGGRQYVSWIVPEDLVGIMLAALDDERWRGAVNATAPAPVRNSELSKALGRALHRPALLPVPRLALKALYGEMSEVVTTGARVVPTKALMNGYEFRYEQLSSALQAVLSQ
ncbi:MAG TPA: TIGR01777 family oxidoreductase [Solirubrobacteraceae bacterium]|nr:TIGR01777 family oxidoreductase [Solirubrobacteraceae bacterium]